MILPKIQIPVSITQFEIFLEDFIIEYNDEPYRSRIEIRKKNLKDAGTEFFLLQGKKLSNHKGFTEIGMLRGLIIKKDRISVRWAVFWLDDSFPGTDFYNKMYDVIYRNWNVKISEFFDDFGNYFGAVNGTKLLVENRYGASSIPGYYRSISDEEVKKVLIFKGATPEESKIAKETREIINRKQAKLIASRNDDEIERYEQIISEFERKLRELSNVDEHNFDLEGLTLLQTKNDKSPPPKIESGSDGIYVPQKEKTRQKWKRYYQIIQETRKEYREDFSDWDNEDPEPSIDDLRDAIAIKSDKKLSERTVYNIIKAGDAGLLK